MNEIELWRKIRDESYERFVFASERLDQAEKAARKDANEQAATNVVKMRAR